MKNYIILSLYSFTILLNIGAAIQSNNHNDFIFTIINTLIASLFIPLFVLTIIEMAKNEKS